MKRRNVAFSAARAGRPRRPPCCMRWWCSRVTLTTSSSKATFGSETLYNSASRDPDAPGSVRRAVDDILGQHRDACARKRDSGWEEVVCVEDAALFKCHKTSPFPHLPWWSGGVKEGRERGEEAHPHGTRSASRASGGRREEGKGSLECAPRGPHPVFVFPVDVHSQTARRGGKCVGAGVQIGTGKRVE